ncbi:hypothetical protein NL676_023807 [Syzygium grande]|nr:hypothetical protein NL676_023807 [Syzygium grande]
MGPAFPILGSTRSSSSIGNDVGGYSEQNRNKTPRNPSPIRHHGYCSPEQPSSSLHPPSFSSFWKDNGEMNRQIESTRWRGKSESDPRSNVISNGERSVSPAARLLSLRLPASHQRPSFLLLQKEANKDVRNKYNKIAYDLVAKHGCTKLFDALKLEDRLCTAARKGEVGQIHRLLESGVAINCHDQNGLTALHRASFKGHTEAVKALLEKESAYTQRTQMDTSPCTVRPNRGTWRP